MSDPPFVLIVEDEQPITRFLVASLARQGYRLRVADSGEQAIAAIDSHLPDLVLLDLGLPDMDGIEVISHIRLSSTVPIVVLSARDREKDKIEALDQGADDYLTKPFGVGELAARLRVALRHQARQSLGGTGEPAGIFESDDLRIDLEKRRVFVGNDEVHLTPIEYRILQSMVSHADRIVTHRMLLREVWGTGYGEEVHQLRVHMANLRRKLEREPARPRHIVTEQAVGYRLVTHD